MKDTALPSVILPTLGKEARPQLHTRTRAQQNLPAGPHTYLCVQGRVLALTYTPVCAHMETVISMNASVHT